MGQIRNSIIRDFQERAGIEPATGQRAAVLSDMSKRAYELIQVIALEEAGIRDGDGQWSGCDPIAGIVRRLEQDLEDLAAGHAASSPQPSDADPGGPTPDAVSEELPEWTRGA